MLHVVPDIRGSRIARVMWEQTRLPFLTRQMGVDLLFSPGFVSPLWGSKAFAACIHDMYYAVIPDLLDTWQRRYWRTFIPLTVRRCRRLVVVSSQTARDLVRIVPAASGKVRVTKLASRMSPSQDAYPPDIPGPYILMVANLTANKNVETVLKGFDIVRLAGIDLRLVHVGRDPDGRLSGRGGSSDSSVIALGKVSDAALAGLYRHAVAVVNASLYEGFGMPAVEAQAMGAPLISSDHPALVEAAGADGALFYDAHQPEQLAAHLTNLLSDVALQADLRERGQKNSSSMSWQKVAEQTLEAFEEIL